MLMWAKSEDYKHWYYKMLRLPCDISWWWPWLANFIRFRSLRKAPLTHLTYFATLPMTVLTLLMSWEFWGWSLCFLKQESGPKVGCEHLATTLVFGSKVDLPEKFGFGQGVPVSYGLAVLAVRRCLWRYDGVWVCCFPFSAAQAPWRHWFGAKWTLSWDNFHRREVITSQRWKASSLFWKDRAFVSLPFSSEIALSMINIVHRLPRPFIQKDEFFQQVGVTSDIFTRPVLQIQWTIGKVGIYLNTTFVWMLERWMRSKRVEILNIWVI